MSKVINYKPGDLIIKEGEDGKGFFILRSGTLNVLKGEKVVGKLKVPGTIFGEMSDILGRHRSCNVKAETDCRVVYLSQGIDEIIRTRPHLTWRLMRDLAQRLEQITEKYSRPGTNPLWCFEEPLGDYDEPE